MGERPDRPSDNKYWVRPWAGVPFSGDLFEAIPFADQPTEIVTGPDEGEASAPHYYGRIAFGFGLLVTPTCDMYESRDRTLQIAHPFRVLVPVLELAWLVKQVPDLDKNLNLMRAKDSLYPYLYLPALPGVFEESAACLFRPMTVADHFLRDPPRRLVQLKPEGRRWLKWKLAAYWGRVAVQLEELAITERDEEQLRVDKWPPSPYDNERPII